MIKKENKRIMITISYKNYNKLCDYAQILKMHPTRLMTRILEMYCNVELSNKPKNK